MRLLIYRFLMTGFNVYYYALLIYALMSWVPSLRSSRLNHFLTAIIEPVVAPLRRLPLQFGGLDFTIFVAMIAVGFVQGLVARLILGFW